MGNMISGFGFNEVNNELQYHPIYSSRDFESVDSPDIINNISTFTQAEWNYISFKFRLSDVFIDQYSDKLSWRYLCEFQKISVETLNKHFKKVDFGIVSKYQELTLELVSFYKYNLNWEVISCRGDLSEEFMSEHGEYLNWSKLFEYQSMSVGFIEKHIDKAVGHWDRISRYQKLSEEFLEKYKDDINWAVLDSKANYDFRIVSRVPTAFISMVSSEISSRKVVDCILIIDIVLILNSKMVTRYKSGSIIQLYDFENYWIFIYEESLYKVNSELAVMVCHG